MAWGWLQTMWRLRRVGVRQRARVALAAGQARSLLGGHAAASTSAATQQRAGQRKVTKSPWSNEHGDRAGYARRAMLKKAKNWPILQEAIYTIIQEPRIKTYPYLQLASAGSRLRG